MKNKNTRQNKISAYSQLHKQNQLKRRQESLKKEAEKKEKKRNALFRRRVREASEKKAPKTLRTKAYYRFSKDYPNDITPDGFRKNDPQKETLSAGKKLAVLIFCISAFLIAFIGVQTAVELSERDIPDNGAAVPEAAEEISYIPRLSPDEFSMTSAEELITAARNNNYSSYLVELKNESGYIFFDSAAAVGGALNPSWEAYKKIDMLESNGIPCIAYISCFKDTVAATSGLDMEVRSSAESTFFDSGSDAWLDPFSEEAKQYLFDLIKEASEGGFSYILLDNVCFPTEYTSEEPVYKADASSADTKNNVLINFINEAVKIAGEDKIITMCDTYGFYRNDDMPNEKYGKNLLGSDCIMYASDLRLTKQDPALTENTALFNYVDDMPMVFILDAAAIASDSLAEAKEASNIFAVVEREPAEASDFAMHSGISNIILW